MYYQINDDMKTLINLVVFTFLFTLAACDKTNENNDPENPNPKAKPVLSVKLVDAPSAFDAVNLEILYMRANLDSNWEDWPLEEPGVYNIQDFTNGNSLLLLGDTTMEPGVISELRLVLGTNNTVVVDGVSYELKTPSGQSSGYKIKMDPQPMEEGGLYRLVIDFDVNVSIHQTGNGKYMLKPVVRGYLETAIGGIAGVVVPPTGTYYAEAVNATDTAGTPINQETGEFLISTVFPGTYDVTCYAADTAYSDTTITGIIVVAGEITLVDTVFLE